MKCNNDCFNCFYDDCIMDYDEIDTRGNEALKQLDYEIKRDKHINGQDVSYDKRRYWNDHLRLRAIENEKYRKNPDLYKMRCKKNADKNRAKRITETEFVTFDNSSGYKRVFKKRLRSAMKISGYTLEKLSRQSGVSVNSISNYLNNRTVPTVGNIIAICETLGCTVNYLLGISRSRILPQCCKYDLSLYDERLYSAMMKYGLDNKSLSEICDCSVRMLKNHRRNNKLPRLDYLYRICSAMSVSSDYLLGITIESEVMNEKN